MCIRFEVARQLLTGHVRAATNASNIRLIVVRVVFCTARVVWKDIRQLIVARISCSVWCPLVAWPCSDRMNSEYWAPSAPGSSLEGLRSTMCFGICFNETRSSHIRCEYEDYSLLQRTRAVQETHLKRFEKEILYSSAVLRVIIYNWFQSPQFDGGMR
jgi:hypothetical protein